ncbi:MAG: S8 family serine peptidase, partial [Thermoplasmatota archaeon]
MLSDNKIAIVSILVAVLLLFSGISAFVTANGEVSEEDEKEGLAENELEGSSAKEDVERPNSIKDRETNSGPDRNKQVPSDVSPYRKESIQNRGKSYLDKELAKEGYIKQKEREATGSSHQRFQSSSGRLDSTSSDSRVLYLEKDELKNLHLEKYNKGERGQYILKMKGPTQGRWLDELQRYDVEILNYMNNMEYRVRTLTSNVDEVEKLGFVEDIRIYQPIQKIDKNIEMGKVIVTLDSSTSSSRNSAISGQLLDRGGSSIVIELESKKDLFSLARDNNVLSIDENHVPHLHDETSSEIVGGYWAPDTPYNGPGNYANELGYNASSIIVSITDTGIGDGTVGDAGHQDFTGRVIGGVDYSGEGTWHDGHAHGTHCAGLVAGDTYNGRGATYANTSYLVGQGVAPEARLFSQKIFDDGGGFGSPDFDTLFKDADDNGVYVHSNSWGGSTSGDYISYDRIYDTKVRDADINEGGDQPMVITVSAGNSGSDSQTTGSPGNAKNVITVGAAENYHPDLDSYGNDYLTSSNADNPDEIADFSSRGPTEDDRIKPDVVASGRGILSTRSPDGSSTLYGEYTQDSNYLWCSGTSMSNPVVAGTASVVVDWYNSTYGTKPSPAMVKSLLVNTAQDLNDTTGNTAHIPNYDEGWGRAYLPPIVDPPVNTIVEDQENLLETGDQVAYPMQYDDPDHPLNISLVWTDAPSDSSNDVHLMNDLEVSVIDPKGKKWHGNAFQNGMSVAETPSGWDYDGDNTDDRNNVVNIFIPEEKLVSGLYTVVVKAENIAMDGVPETAAVDQDYALTIYNGEEFQGDTPSISVYRPTNGDTWASNSVEPIKWVTGGGNGTLTVDLEYSVDNGTTWNAISSGLADTGIYNWTVAYEDSTECRIRATVTDSETDTNTSLSGKFEITPVLIDVLTPDGGEVWFGNTTKTITWNTTGGTDPKTVDLWYSLNNGSTWNSIASGLTDNGSYTWSIPNNESNEALVKAQVVDGASDSYVDLSEDTFRILALKESPWFDDMESGMGSWYPEDTSNTVWELGDP